MKDSMRRLVIITCVLLVNVSQSFAQDYDGSWNRPTINQASDDFKYAYFGRVEPYYHKPGIDIHSLPPIPGLKYRSYSIFCQKDTCYAARAVIAIRCPEDPVLMHWSSSRAAKFAEWCNGIIEHDGTRYNILKVSSSADICNLYIRCIQKSFNQLTCDEIGDHGTPNEQFAFLLTDCWRTDKYCTFYESKWYDWMSCGDNTTESYFSVNIETGEIATVTDFVREKDLPRLANLMMKYLKNYKGELWVYPDFEWVASEPLDLLKQMNGCALIREGLVIYYHPYEIGCGADGHFKAVIPYSELKGILLINK